MLHHVRKHSSKSCINIRKLRQQEQPGSICKYHELFSVCPEEITEDIHYHTNNEIFKLWLKNLTDVFVSGGRGMTFFLKFYINIYLAPKWQE